MLDSLVNYLDSSAFMPHGHCYLWRGDVLWLNVLSDLMIAASYFSIPIALVVFVRKRKDLAFNWIFIMFAAFIFACGTTHLLEIWTVWHPDYVQQGLVKLFTAIVSCATAFVLWPLMPKALELPSAAQLESANARLGQEIAGKVKIENELIEAKRDLELRVEQRTAELRRANKMKDEFLTTLSHELRTPLNVIMGYTDLLRLEEPGSAEFKHAIETIHRNAKIQADLIEDLLDVSRIITGKIQLESHLVEPAAMISFAIDGLKLSAETKNIKIETEFDEFTGFIIGDSTRLQQVLWNLLANAIKFSGKGGKILVSTRRHESKLEIKVRDWGRGIDQEFLPYVFDRFRQEDSSTTRGYGGLGLGLAIVRHIVELHGGVVYAESEGKGKGASFVIQMPIMVVPPQRPMHDFSVIPPSLRHGGSTTVSKILTGVDILVVDDERDTRTLLRSILSLAGANVKIAESAQEARDILTGWLPKVIISDIGMREEDGFTFIKKLRAAKDRPESKIPAIALTAYARSEDRDMAINAGFQSHATKPISAQHLVEVIARVLQGG